MDNLLENFFLTEGPLTSYLPFYNQLFMELCPVNKCKSGNISRDLPKVSFQRLTDDLKLNNKATKTMTSTIPVKC